MKRRTIAYALILSTAAGTAWAFGGPGGDCDRGPGRGMPPAERMPMGGPEAPPMGPPMEPPRLDRLSPEQRQAARELLDQGRAEELELQREISNARFELMKLGLAKEWDRQAAEQQTRKLADAMAALELRRAELRHELRGLGEAKE